MDSNHEIEDLEFLSEDAETDESTSVDDFIKELEAKEKDLHITSETTFIEIAADFEDGDLPDFLQQDIQSNGRKTVEPSVAETDYSNQKSPSQVENEISELKAQIAKMETERSEMFQNSQRRSKDFAAYKSRMERERGETFQNQLSNLATQMLPALDNLDRALQFASDMPEAKRNEFEQFFDGIVLVNQQVNEVLAGMGIQPIATVGETFDPHFHEAVAIEESGDFPADLICEELLRGYRIGDKVIRHSMVKVSKPSKKNQPAQIVENGDYGEIEFVSEFGITRHIDSSNPMEDIEVIDPADEIVFEVSDPDED